MPLTLDQPTPTVLHGLSWASYRQLRADAEPSVRMTFDNGTLEIMPPISMGHGRRTHLLACLVQTYMDHVGVVYEGIDVVTLEREDLLRGCEGDRMYYVRATPPPLDVEELDLLIHDAPDLVIEVDLSSRSVDKEPLYAAFGVTELFRLERDTLRLRHLTGNTYEDVDVSGLLPGLDVPLLREHVALRPVLPQREIVRRWRGCLGG